MTSRVSATRSFCLLLMILILGGYLRFQGAEQRGPSFFDEGIYTLEGKWIYTFSKALFSCLKRKIEEVRLRQDLYSFEGEAKRFQETIEGEPPVWGRPGFSLLTGICMGLLGPRINATHLVAALFGTLSILGVFLLGRVMFDDRVGLLAALLLAISGYHLVYSVTGLSDGPAMCFALFAMYLYYKSKLREGKGRGGYLLAVLAGFGLGLAFAIHDRMLYVFLVLLLNEGIDLIRGKNQRKRRLKKMAVLGASFLLPIGLFEFPYYLGMIFLRHFGETLPFRTYFEELLTHHLFNFFDFFAVSLVDLKKYPEFQEAGSRLWNFVTYPYLFMQFDGIVFCLLFLGGSVAAFLQRRYEDRLLWVWLLVPFFLFSTGLSTNVRYALVFMPAAFLIAARSLWLLDRVLAGTSLLGKPAARVVAVALPVFVLLSGWLASSEIRQMHCTYTAPVTFLKENGPKHISLQYPVTKAYLGPENVKEPPFTWEQLEAAYQEGYRYYLIDFRKFFLKPPFGESEKGEIIADIESTIEPAFSYVHPCYTSPCYLFEINAFFCLTQKIVREAHERGIDLIQIYDLQEYFRKKEVP